mmetsp:Transcript_3591/g.12678  ORF Transcript_3591/g.12678 Transcript_3591/m.12678 type:complete len:314 (-) Transcript_3591:2036-2977(-)
MGRSRLLLAAERLLPPFCPSPSQSPLETARDLPPPPTAALALPCSALPGGPEGRKGLPGGCCPPSQSSVTTTVSVILWGRLLGRRTTAGEADIERDVRTFPGAAVTPLSTVAVAVTTAAAAAAVAVTVAFVVSLRLPDFVAAPILDPPLALEPPKPTSTAWFAVVFFSAVPDTAVGSDPTLTCLQAPSARSEEYAALMRSCTATSRLQNSGLSLLSSRIAGKYCSTVLLRMAISKSRKILSPTATRGASGRTTAMEWVYSWRPPWLSRMKGLMPFMKGSRSPNSFMLARVWSTLPTSLRFLSPIFVGGSLRRS